VDVAPFGSTITPNTPLRSANMILFNRNSRPWSVAGLVAVIGCATLTAAALNPARRPRLTGGHNAGAARLDGIEPRLAFLQATV
jgi:hypothetical protein